MTSLDERVNFEINGTDLLLPEINTYCTTKANHRKILETMKELSVNNNTTGASIFDLGKVLQSDSIGSLNVVLKQAEDKANKLRAEERAHAEKLQQMQNEQATKEKQMDQDERAILEEKKNRKDILVAEIRASGFGAMQDINQNNQSDFVDQMVKIKQSEGYQQTIGIQQEKVNINQSQHADKVALKKDEMNLKRELKDKDLQIAETNKNQYDFGGGVKKEKTTKEPKKKKS